MKKQWLMMLALGLALISCAQTKDKGNPAAGIDHFLTHQAGLNKLNGTVLVAKQGHVLLNKGYGYRNAEDQVLHDSSSIFQIYSITKTFTSTMIFRLIEEKKLSLDDRLSKFYPGFPNGDNITIDHLLTHTSGINDQTDSDAPQTEAYRVAQFGKNIPHFAPGDGWAYCNGGYQLLGYIIQQLTGLSYERAIRETIFKPLGMTHSGFDYKGLSSPHKSVAYHRFSNERKDVAQLYDSTGPFAAGSIYSSVGDLFRYYKSFRSHKIISESSQAIAFAPGKNNERYGHGWQLSKVLMKSGVVSHSGGATGFRSNFAMVPEEDICIIILNNHENANPEYLTGKIIDLLNGKNIEGAQEVKLTSAELAPLIGAYRISEPQPMMIYTSIMDARLAIDVAGQGPTVVIATGAHTFLQDEADAVLTFSKDVHGVFSELEISQGWMKKLRAKRVASTWGILGDATAKGWDDSTPDLRLAEDSTRKGVWRIHAIEMKQGDFKFRLDNDWGHNLGDLHGDQLLEDSGPNIRVEAGVYDIVLDLTDPTRPRYTLARLSHP
ncbi:MAG: serine hydrolase [Cyclobacteriaceae bacterium]|nr:serine hydrolase [Cyclobacteriaceae bacterium]